MQKISLNFFKKIYKSPSNIRVIQQKYLLNNLQLHSLNTVSSRRYHFITYLINTYSQNLTDQHFKTSAEFNGIQSFMKSILNFFTGNKTQVQNNQIPQQSFNFGFQSQSAQQNTSSPQIRLVTPKKPNAKIVAVVVTFCEGSSYDNLFVRQEQKSQEGTQTLVYSATESAMTEIINSFNKDSKNQLINQLVKEIKKLDVDCTVFNWECCSSYSSHHFCNRGNIFNFVQFMLNRGHMLMFSDFSLKALIGDWQQNILGPLPFLKVNEFTGNVVLKFNPQTLIKCPSAQLQLVGTLSDGGMCNVSAAGGTIGYTVDWKVSSKTDKYKLQLLSVASNLSAEISPCQISTAKGAAGHCLLTYPNGGRILTSMTHWVSLMEIDTSQKKLIEAAELNYGYEAARKMQCDMQCMDVSQKRSYMQNKAQQYIQTSAPCNNFMQKQRVNSKFS